MNKHIALLIISIIIGSIFRLYQLGSIPAGLYQDETAIGYNAYSLLQTGRDEYGKNFPLYFKSFGDYKLPLYIYTTAASVKLFGLTPFAVRFPSALFGIFALPLFYLVLTKLSKNTLLAAIATLLLSINPWHIHYSRATFEVSMALPIFLLGTYMLLSKKSWAIIIGTLCFVLNVYAYNLTRILSPLLFGAVIFSQWDSLKQTKKPTWIVTILLSIILLLPMIFTIFSKGGASSASGTLIPTSAAIQAPLLELRSYILTLPFGLSKILFNTYILSTWQYVQHLAQFLSIDFFFIHGPTHGNHGIGNTGLFYLFELPLMLIGLYATKSFFPKVTTLLFSWTILTIAVVAFTRESPHATRSFFLLFPLITLSASGVLMIIEKLKKTKLPQKIAAATFAGFALYCIFMYGASYVLRFPIYYAKQWKLGDAKLMEFLKEDNHRYDQIIIDKKSGFLYSSYLFYTEYDPANFQNTVQRTPDDSEGFTEVTSFGNVEIRDIQWDTDTKLPNTLIITTPNQKPDAVPPYHTIYYPGRPVVFALKQEIISYPVEEIAYTLVKTN